MFFSVLFLAPYGWIQKIQDPFYIFKFISVSCTYEHPFSLSEFMSSRSGTGRNASPASGRASTTATPDSRLRQVRKRSRKGGRRKRYRHQSGGAWKTGRLSPCQTCTSSSTGRRTRRAGRCGPTASRISKTRCNSSLPFSFLRLYVSCQTLFAPQVSWQHWALQSFKEGKSILFEDMLRLEKDEVYGQEFDALFFMRCIVEGRLNEQPLLILVFCTMDCRF